MSKRPSESESEQAAKRSKTEEKAKEAEWKQNTSEVFKRLTASKPFFLLAGPCVIEGLEHALMMAGKIKEIGERLGIEIVYKSSFDKANRTSHAGHRGPGIEKGLEILRAVKEKYGMLIVTDVHEPWQCEKVAEVADIIQIPAFLCRQTDLLKAAAKTGKVINIKKGQFAGAQIALESGRKVAHFGEHGNIMLCDRGNSYGYGDLIVDPRNLVRMRTGGWPVVQDCTHAVQQPAVSADKTCSGGLREFVPTIARMAVAVGVTGLFFETHDQPEKALCDGPNQIRLCDFEPLLKELIDIANASKGLTAKLTA